MPNIDRVNSTKDLSKINKNLIYVLNDFAKKANINSISVNFNINDGVNGVSVYAFNNKPITNIKDSSNVLSKYLLDNKFTKLNKPNKNTPKFFVVLEDQIFVFTNEKQLPNQTQMQGQSDKNDGLGTYATGRTNNSTSDVLGDYKYGRTTLVSSIDDYSVIKEIAKSYKKLTKSNLLYLIENATEMFMPPLKDYSKYKINSEFGKYRPQYGRTHKGIDIGSPSGTEVIAPLDGVVDESKDNASECGGFIKIKHNDNLYTKYCHIKKREVEKGAEVKQGDVIGISGGGLEDPNRGTTSGAHLHFEVIKDGIHVDPALYMGKSINTDKSTTTKNNAIYAARTDMATDASLEVTESIYNRLIKEQRSKDKNATIISSIKSFGSGEFISEYEYRIDGKGNKTDLNCTFKTCEKHQINTIYNKTTFKCKTSDDRSVNVIINGNLKKITNGVISKGKKMGEYSGKLDFSAERGFFEIPLNPRSVDSVSTKSGRTGMATDAKLPGGRTDSTASNSDFGGRTDSTSSTDLLPGKTDMSANIDFLGYGRNNETLLNNIDRIKKLLT